MDLAFARGRRRTGRPGAVLMTACVLLGGLASASGTHVVRPGDTLSAIARLYDSTVAELREENALVSDLLRVGDVLRLPGPDGWRTLTPEEGTTWAVLADRTGIGEATLRAANPGVAEPAGHEVRVAPVDGPLVWPAAGEDLIALAARLGVAPGRLATVNGMTAPYELEVGVPLVMPSPEPTSSSPLVPPPAIAAPGGGERGPPVGGTTVPGGPQRRAAHAALRGEALGGLAALLEGRVLAPPDDGFDWPLQGAPRLTSHFGWRNVSVGGNRYHQGIDLGAATGTPVHASREGVVTRAAWVGAYGYAVYLAHDGGYETRYAHLSRVAVRVGQVVARGEEIGAVGSTGASTGPHLHFEARLDGRALDPLAILPGAR